VEIPFLLSPYTFHRRHRTVDWLLLSAPILLAAASLAAHADTYYFTFTGANVDDFSFSGPSSFRTGGGNNLGIYLENVAVDLRGVTSNREVGFYVPGNLGGLGFTSSTHPYAYDGPQLFVGDYVPPFRDLHGYYDGGAFILGTYTLQETLGDHLGTGTLVISDAPASITPEPSSFLLLGSGLLGACGVLRRKLI